MITLSCRHTCTSEAYTILLSSAHGCDCDWIGVTMSSSFSTKESKIDYIIPMTSNNSMYILCVKTPCSHKYSVSCVNGFGRNSFAKICGRQWTFAMVLVCAKTMTRSGHPGCLEMRHLACPSNGVVVTASFLLMWM